MNEILSWKLSAGRGSSVTANPLRQEASIPGTPRPPPLNTFFISVIPPANHDLKHALLDTLKTLIARVGVDLLFHDTLLFPY